MLGPTLGATFSVCSSASRFRRAVILNASLATLAFLCFSLLKGHCDERVERIADSTTLEGELLRTKMVECY